MKTYGSSVDACGLRFAVVVARFNHLICAKLLEGCAAELARRGADADDIHVAWVPGAFEIPLAARVLAARGVNVEELLTECTDAPMSGLQLFQARAQLRLPAGVTVDRLRDELETVAQSLMVDLTLVDIWLSAPPIL